MSDAAAPSQMTFWEHLQELRVRLVRSALIVMAGFGITYWQRFRLWDWAQRPFMEVFKAHSLAHAKALGLPPPTTFEPFAFTSLTEPFFSLMRISLWAAAFLVAPLLFYQLWAFIRPGLYEKERRMVIPFVFITSACFLGGAAFAYFNAFHFLGDILFKEAMDAGLRTNLHLEDYLDLFIYTVVGTGLMFELPVLVYFLARFRVVTAQTLLKYWRHATVGIVIAAAFLTPGDVIVTTIFFSAILLALYFASVLVAWFAAPKSSDPSGSGILR
ncbi:MAG: twin-arginine translocase subunit TatC [Firmicutes bacterium]|nr:twin-arginine translocase subunit TatC [Bacillota bacterium]